MLKLLSLEQPEGLLGLPACRPSCLALPCLFPSSGTDPGPSPLHARPVLLLCLHLLTSALLPRPSPLHLLPDLPCPPASAQGSEVPGISVKFFKKFRGPNKATNFYLFIFFLKKCIILAAACSMQQPDVGSSFPDQRWNPGRFGESAES